MFLALSTALSNGPSDSWRRGAVILVACLLAFWIGPAFLLLIMFLASQAFPHAWSRSHGVNSIAAFAIGLPQVVFPYWGLAAQDEHHWLMAWKFRAPLLGLGTAWGVTVLQWGIVAIAFGALVRPVREAWHVVVAAVTTIIAVTGLALAVFAIPKLTVQVESI